MVGYSNETSWKKFTEHHMLLRNLENGGLDDLTMASAEKFICRVCNVADSENCSEARATLFSRCRSPEALPRRVMQRDCILDGWHTSKQKYGNKPFWHTLPFHFQTLWAGED